MASAFFVPFTRITAASEPGPTIVLDCTMWSYCSHTHWRLRQIRRCDGKFQQRLFQSWLCRHKECFDQRRLAAIEEA